MNKTALAAFFDELEKIAKNEAKEKAMEGAAKARPWVSSAVKGAVPAAVAANFLLPFEGKAKSRLVATIGALGGAAGLTDRYLKRWARKHKRRKAAKEILKQEKLGAMAGDLRRLGLGGVKRPPFPTEDSKRQAFNMLRNSKQPGLFTAKTEAKNLMKPGPSISQVATSV
jgi:hypothetical protein